MDPCIILFFDIVLMIILLVRKIPLWAIFLVIGLTTSLSIGGTFFVVNVFYKVLVDSNTWDLVVIMFLISVLVSTYRISGFIDKLGEELTLFLRRPRLIAVIVPAVLGLLPVPGGALMSAPIVDRVGDYLGLSRTRKLFVNVWFRHIIFIVYPLSTVLVLTAVLTGSNLWDLIVKQLPIAVLMAVIGFILGFPRKTRDQGLEDYLRRDCDKRVLFKTFTPILATIVLAILLSPLIDYRFPLPVNRLSMIIGVSAGILILKYTAGINACKLCRIMVSREVLELTFIGFTAMFLRMVFSMIDLKCITSYIPLSNPLILVITIPILFSLIAGVASSSVALSISILAGIVEFDVKTASLIYLSAFMGYLGSPLHLCYVYTAQYLKTPLVKGYKYMLPAIALTLGATLLFYTIIW